MSPLPGSGRSLKMEHAQSSQAFCSSFSARWLLTPRQSLKLKQPSATQSLATTCRSLQRPWSASLLYLICFRPPPWQKRAKHRWTTSAGLKDGSLQNKIAASGTKRSPSWAFKPSGHRLRCKGHLSPTRCQQRPATNPTPIHCRQILPREERRSIWDKPWTAL